MERVWRYLEERFGIPRSVRCRYALWGKGEAYFALSAADEAPGQWACLRVVAVGSPLLRRVSSHLKPTTAGLRILSPWVTRNRIFLDDGEARAILMEGAIPWPAEGPEGYVLLETEAGVLGCGLLVGGRLRSQIPRSETAALPRP